MSQTKSALNGVFEIFDDFSIRKKGPIVDWMFQQLQNKTLGFPSTCVKYFDCFGIFTGFPFILFKEVRNVKKTLMLETLNLKQFYL